jgi:hypothetical protein
LKTEKNNKNKKTTAKGTEGKIQSTKGQINQMLSGEVI